MPKEALLEQYYFNPEREPNTFMSYLGDCIAKNIYFLLRNHFRDIQDIRKIFFEDFTFTLCLQSDNKIAKLMINYIEHPCNLFDKTVYKYIENDKDQALKQLRDLLDQNKIVFAGTIMSKVPFYKTYSADSLLSPYNNIDNHRFLIIWYQDDYFYFVEDYENLVKARYYPYEKNFGVGIIKEEDLAIPFSYFARFEVFEPNLEKFKNVDKRFCCMIDTVIENYYKNETINKDGIRNLQGRAAIKELIKLCGVENIKLNEKPTMYNLSDISGRFDRLIVLATNRKILFKDLLINSKNSSRFQKIIDALDTSIEKWVFLKNGIRKEYFKKNFVMGHQLKNFFINVLLAEDKLFKVIEEEKNSFNTIYNFI